jgi:hypothetical protein
MPCLRISEDEAILLGLRLDFSLGEGARARTTRALLADGDSVGPIAKAIATTTRRSIAAGFDMPVLAAGAMTCQESLSDE